MKKLSLLFFLLAVTGMSLQAAEKPDRIYPNPVSANDKAYFLYDVSGTGDVEMTVFSLSGEPDGKYGVKNVTGRGKLYIDTGKLETGLYICIIKYKISGQDDRQVAVRMVYTHKPIKKYQKSGAISPIFPAGN